MREKVSPNLFAMLGAKTEAGARILAEQPGFGAVKNAGSIVLSDQVWHAAFGGDPNIVGKTVRSTISRTPWSASCRPGSAFR